MARFFRKIRALIQINLFYLSHNSQILMPSLLNAQFSTKKAYRMTQIIEYYTIFISEHTTSTCFIGLCVLNYFSFLPGVLLQKILSYLLRITDPHSNTGMWRQFILLLMNESLHEYHEGYSFLVILNPVCTKFLFINSLRVTENYLEPKGEMNIPK